MAELMIKNVDIYWSHQSPYCYFALDRILALQARQDVKASLRLVLPGVLRNPDKFRNASPLEETYFFKDVRRTADYLGLPYGEATPYPVSMQPETVFRAAARQPRIHRLYHLTAAADQIGRGWEFLDQVTRLIWDGTVSNWHRGGLLQNAVQRAGLDFQRLDQLAFERSEAYDRLFASNHEALLAAGHWGVPTFVYRDEAFFGQDRFDQLLWRMSAADS